MIILTLEQIIEGNKLIAKSILAEEDIINWINDITNPSNKFCYKTLQFHSSWDWLMPVIEKFESIGGLVKIEKTGILVYHPGIIEINFSVMSFVLNGKVFSSENKLRGVWLGIVNFLKEYNEKVKMQQS